MGLRDFGTKLPPGFRFYPSDEELVCHYLYKKIANEDVLMGSLVEVDLHSCEPWQLPEAAKLNSSEWYFFNFRDRKYATGNRTNRATKTGYWKATGKDKTVVDPKTRTLVGMRKTLVFYKNRAPNGIKTGWIMHEFRLENPHISPKEDWVLCRVCYKEKGENINDFSSQNSISHATSPITETDPLHTADNQLPPCGCYHQITTNFSDETPPFYHHNDYSYFSFPQLQQEPYKQACVCLNTKCQDHESGLFSDLDFEFGIPSPLRFVNDGNEGCGLVFL